MESPATPLVTAQQLRYMAAASVLAVAAAVLVGFSLLTGGLNEASAPSGVAFLFILPTIALMYVDVRKRRRAAFGVEFPAMLVMLLGEIIADVSGKALLGKGGSIVSVLIPEAMLFVLFYAFFLRSRAKALRSRTSSNATTR